MSTGWPSRDTLRGAVGTMARVGLVASVVLAVLLTAIVVGINTNDYRGTDQADAQGAFRLLRDRSFGPVLLLGVAGACALHALWRAAQALAPELDEGVPDDPWSRVGSGLVGLGYAVLAVAAVTTALGSGASGGNQEEALTALVMGWPGGRVLVFAVGAGIVVGGCGLVWWAATRGFREQVDLDGLAPRWRRAGVAVLLAGFVARGTVVAVVGAFLAHAALQHDPHGGVGLDGALSEIVREPWATPALHALTAALAAWALAAAVRVGVWRVGDGGRLGR